MARAEGACFQLDRNGQGPETNVFPARDHSEVPLRDEVHYLAVNKDGKQVRVV